MDIRMNFGLRIRELRARSGMTQEVLAERAQLDRAYVSDVERGKQNITLLNIERIASALRVSVEYIFSPERFSTKLAYSKRDFDVPFADRFRFHLDEEMRVLSFEVNGLFANKEDVRYLSSRILGICSAYGSKGLRVLVDHRAMLTADGEPAVYSPEIVEAAITFQKHLHHYSKQTIVLCNSEFMVDQFNHVTQESGITSQHLFGKSTDIVNEAYHLLKINGNALVTPTSQRLHPL